MPSIVYEGRLFPLVLLVLILVTILYWMSKTKKGILPKVRRLPALDSIEEGVGRATELGRPVLNVQGTSTLYSEGAGASMAGVSLLNYVAGVCAKYNARLISITPIPEQIPLLQDVVKTQFTAAGKPELYRPEDIRYFPIHFPWVTATIGTMGREKPGCNIFTGTYGHESIVFAESGHLSGGFNIGGTPSLAQVPWFVTSCEYLFIAEEYYVASAYVAKDPDQLASVAGTDIIKFLILAIIIIGTLSMTLGTTAMLDALKL